VQETRSRLKLLRSSHSEVAWEKGLGFWRTGESETDLLLRPGIRARRADSIQSVIALDTPIQFVKGVGPRVAEKLKERNILVVEDLLYHLPFRYEDRLNPRSMNELVPGEMASVIAEVRGTVLLRT
jgi:hypothetical protein